VAAALLLRRFGAEDILVSLRSVLLFLALGCGLSPLLGATAGAAMVAYAVGAPFLPIWETWWIADAAGILMVTPALTAWAHRDRGFRLTAARAIEFAAIAAVLLTALWFGFLSLVDYSLLGRVALVAVLPLMIWATIRFGRGGATLAVLLMAVGVTTAVFVNSRIDPRPLLGHAPARIVVRWTRLDDRGWEAALRPVGARTALNAVAAHLPDRLAETLMDMARVDRRRKLSQLVRDERNRLIDTLVRGELPWTGDEGYKKAEVTGGGVRLSDIDPRTMESRRHPGLFLCGEMLDAFGPIGGYNFLWAWATGRAAGIGAATASRHHEWYAG
jgi:hypothetical protein